MQLKIRNGKVYRGLTEIKPANGKYLGFTFEEIEIANNQPPIVAHEQPKELHTAKEKLHTESKKPEILHTVSAITHGQTANGYNSANNIDKLTHGKNSGIKNSKFTGYFVINGVQYPSVRIAEKITGIKAKTIYNRCHASKDGFSFVPK